MRELWKVKGVSKKVSISSEICIFWVLDNMVAHLKGYEIEGKTSEKSCGRGHGRCDHRGDVAVMGRGGKTSEKEIITI